LGGQDGLILQPVFPLFHQDCPPFVVLVEFLTRQLLIAGLNLLVASGDLSLQLGDLPFEADQGFCEFSSLLEALVLLARDLGAAVGVVLGMLGALDGLDSSSGAPLMGSTSCIFFHK